MPNLANILNNIVSDSSISTTSYINGTSGISGTSGTSGNNGISGTSGTSAIGAAGTSGNKGSSGTSGASGASASNGTNGSSGTSGTSGSSGINGANGTSGVNTTGSTGANGTSGTNGITTFASNAISSNVSGGFLYFETSNTLRDSPMTWQRVQCPGYPYSCSTYYDFYAITIGGGVLNNEFVGWQVNGSLYVESLINSYPTRDYTITSFGKLMYIDQNGMIGYLPSIRKSKINIQPLTNISWLDNLKPASYNYKKRDENRNLTEESEDELKYGFIAEDTESINPELVFHNTSTQEKEVSGFHYDKMIIPLLAKVQELEKRIKLLKEKKGLI
jgi:hypothetical protein